MIPSKNQLILFDLFTSISLVQVLRSAASLLCLNLLLRRMVKIYTILTFTANTIGNQFVNFERQKLVGASVIHRLVQASLNTVVLGRSYFETFHVALILYKLAKGDLYQQLCYSRIEHKWFLLYPLFCRSSFSYTVSTMAFTELVYQC